MLQVLLNVLEMIKCHSKAFHGEDVPVAGGLILNSADRETLGLLFVRLLFKDGYSSVIITAEMLLTHISKLRAGERFSSYSYLIGGNEGIGM